MAEKEVEKVDWEPEEAIVVREGRGGEGRGGEGRGGEGSRPVHKMLRFLPIMLCSDSFKMPLLCPVTPPIMLALCPLCSLSPHIFWAKLRHA